MAEPISRPQPKTGIVRDSYTQLWDSADSWDSQQPWDGQRGPTKYIVGTQGEPEKVKPGT